MPDYQLDAASGCKLIGGEMLHWSDLVGEVSPAAVEFLVGEMLPARGSGGRVLLAGPRAAGLLETLPSDLAVDLLVRGLPDARELANIARVRGDVTVYCGSIDRFEPDESYGLIISLDGPDGLMSPDGEGLSGAALMAKFSGWLMPDGVLAATVVNELGFDRMFRLDIHRDHSSDRSWYRGATGYDDRHAYRHELSRQLAAASLTSVATLGVFPAVDNPALLVSDRLSQSDIPGAASAAVGCMAARVESAHFSARPALIDVHDLALRVFEGGLALQLCPLWLVIAQPEDRATAISPALPLALFSGETGRAEWRAVTSIESSEGKWVYRMRSHVGAQQTRERNVLRDFSRIPGDLPSGITLEVLLRRACAVNDVGEVRRLAQSYARWLRVPRPAPDGTADGRFFLTPSNVVVVDGALAAIDPTWYLTGEETWSLLVVRGLRDFARRFLASGAEHPWTPDISPDALTHTLVAMAGVGWEPSQLHHIARLEAEVETVLRGGDATFEALAFQTNLESGQSQASSRPGPSRGYREAVASNGRLAEALVDRSGQVEWLEAALRARDIRLGELERTVSHIRGSLSFRIGRGVTWPLRSWVGAVRRLGLSLVPPAYVHKAKRLAQRLAAS
jgi:hypothetical protein